MGRQISAGAVEEWEQCSRQDENAKKTDEGRCNASHGMVEMPEKNEKPREETCECELEEHRDEDHDAFHAPLLEIIEAVLTCPSDLAGGPGQPDFVFIQPLLHHYADRCGGETREGGSLRHCAAGDLITVRYQRDAKRYAAGWRESDPTRKAGVADTIER